MWKDASQMYQDAITNARLAHRCHRATSVVKWQVGNLRCVEETDFSLCGCFSPFEAQDRKSLRREADVEGIAVTSMAH